MPLELDALRRRAQAHAQAQDGLEPEHASQVRSWLDADDTRALRQAFEPPLRFGTAGVRAPLGAGDARINRLTVRRLATALCQYLQAQDADAPGAGLCIGFDGRHGSAMFAADFAQVAGALGFAVHAFEVPVPTPLLAHATATRGAAAGAMITASHNPPGDNGVKLYWRGGQPLLPPHDAQLEARMAVATPPAADAPCPPPTPLAADALDAYLQAILTALPEPPPGVPLPSLAYSAMCGVGRPTTRALLDRLGAPPAHEVRAECEPDPDFTGLASPNPEHPRALDPVMTLAVQHRCALAVAHDPDADRLAVAVRDGSSMVRLSGDEVGCLLADYLLDRAPATPTAGVVTSLVSSELLGCIAEARGALYRRVPTGLKWISRAGRALEAEAGARYVFGYEEALGYCLPTLGDDKDGLAALALLLRCHQHHAAEGRSLGEARDALFRTHGVHRTLQRTWRFDDPGGRSEVIERAGHRPPLALGATHGGRIEVDPRAPELRLLRYVGQGTRLRVALRPSGTEPKLKAYLELRLDPSNDVRGAIERADAELARVADALDAWLEHLREAL